MKKALLSSALVLSFVISPMMALAEGAIMWSNERLPGYEYDKDSESFYKHVDLDPNLAENIGKWTMRIETRDNPAAGFLWDKDENTYKKVTVLEHNPLTDGPAFCTHITWSNERKKGFVYDRDSESFYKVAILTLEEADRQGLR